MQTHLPSKRHLQVLQTLKDIVNVTYSGTYGPLSAHVVNTSGVPAEAKSSLQKLSTFYNYIYSEFFAIIVFPEQPFPSIKSTLKVIHT